MRKVYIDNIRWITVVIVVIYHVIYMFNGITPYGVIGPFSEFQPQDVYMYLVYPWFMLALFVVSGMSARFELDKKSEKDFLKTRTRKYLVPSTIGLFVFWWILGYYNMLIGGAFEQMTNMPKFVLFLIMCVSGIGPLWYIQMLWLFSVLLIVIRKLEKDRLYSLTNKTNVIVLFLLNFVIYGAAQILNTPIIVVYRFGIYGTGFLLGYYVFSHDEVMNRLGKYWYIFVGFGLLTCLIFVINYWGKPYPEHIVLDTFVCNLFAWFATLAILAFMKRFGNFENQFTAFMKKQSFGLYMFHYLFIAVSSWYLKMYALNMKAIFVYAIVFITSIVGSFILNYLISKIPFIRWCVLGIKKEAK